MIKKDMRLLQDATLKGKAVFVRGDLDIKLSPLDEFRLRALLPTLKLLTEEKSKVVLAGHLDRPHGKVVEELRTQAITDWIANQGFSVKYSRTTLPNRQTLRHLRPKTILLLENLRFDAREEKNDTGFAHQLANLADIYVNEAFANSHRTHTSMVGITQFLPSYAGLHLQKELAALSKVLFRPTRPLIFVMGGAKNETKVPLVQAFAKTADAILLGGTLMFAQHLEGTPKVRFAVDATGIYDIGPKTVVLFKDYLDRAGTIVWNGPMGKFEQTQFAKGTQEIARAILRSKASQIIIGGGDTIDALRELGLLEKAQKNPRVFLSTGGGAMLSFLAQKKLPALFALGFRYPT